MARNVKARGFSVRQRQQSIGLVLPANSIDNSKLATPVQQSLISAGDIKPHGGGTLPSGYLPCDGTLLVGGVNNYPALFAVIGYTFGGSGSDFAVPDLRGRSPIGDGNGVGLTARTRGQAIGAESHTLSSTESGTANHGHGVTDGGHYHATTMRDITHGGTWGAATVPFHWYGVYNGDQARADAWLTSEARRASNINASGTDISVNNNTGASAASAHNNMQPSLVVKFVIKY